MKNAKPRKLSDVQGLAIPDLPPSLPELAYQYLRDAILNGQLAFGAAIRQEDIGARLGISRLPIREALRRLEAEGLVVLKPRRGYSVTSLSWEEIEDIFDTAAVLEERAGYLATQKRTDADIEAMEAALRDLDSFMRRGTARDLAAFGKANARFHSRLMATADRPYLSRLLTTVQNNVEHYVRVGAGLVPELDASNREHHAIFDAFKRGDADTVGSLCRLHRKSTGRRLLDYLQAKAPE